MWYSCGSYTSHLPVSHPTGGYKDSIDVWYLEALEDDLRGGSKDLPLTSTLIKLLVEAIPLPIASLEIVIGSFFLTYFLIV